MVTVPYSWRIKWKYRNYLEKRYKVWSIRELIARAKRGFSYGDVFSFDYYLCWMLPNAFKEMREKGYSFPHTLFDEKGKPYPRPKKDPNLNIREIDIDELGFSNAMAETWDELLKTIEDGFNGWVAIDNGYQDEQGEWHWYEYTSKEYKDAEKALKKSLLLVAHNFQNFWI